MFQSQFTHAHPLQLRRAAEHRWFTQYLRLPLRIRSASRGGVRCVYRGASIRFLVASATLYLARASRRPAAYAVGVLARSRLSAKTGTREHLPIPMVGADASPQRAAAWGSGHRRRRPVFKFYFTPLACRRGKPFLVLPPTAVRSAFKLTQLFRYGPRARHTLRLTPPGVSVGSFAHVALKWRPPVGQYP